MSDFTEWAVALMRDGDAFEIVGAERRTEDLVRSDLADWRDLAPDAPLTVAWRHVGDWNVAL